MRIERPELAPVISPESYESLVKKGCVFRYFKDGDFQIPSEVDLSPFKDSEYGENFYQSIFNVFAFYVQMPAISDTLEDHFVRRKWIMRELTSEEHFASNMNRLRGNPICSTWMYLNEIADHLDEADERRLRITEISKAYEYLVDIAHSGQNEKIEDVDRYTEAILEVLNMFRIPDRDIHSQTVSS